jgi:hypothetical protein
LNARRRSLRAWSARPSQRGDTRPAPGEQRPDATRIVVAVVGRPDTEAARFAQCLLVACRRHAVEAAVLASAPGDTRAHLERALDALPAGVLVVATGDAFAGALRPWLLVDVDAAVRRRPPSEGVDVALADASERIADAVAAWFAARREVLVAPRAGG